MNKRTARLFWTTFLIFAHSVSAPALTILTEQWPPVSFENEKGQADGLAVELAREVQKSVGTKDNIQVVPWARGYDMLTSQPEVLLFAVAYTEERSRLFAMVGPIVQGEIAFFEKKGRGLSIKSLEDAKKWNVGTYRATNFESFLATHQFPKVDLARTPVLGATKLMKGRIDLLVEDSVVMSEVLRAAGFQRSDVQKVWVAERTELFFGFSKGTPRSTVEAWAEALKKLKKNGQFQKIYKKWLPEEAPPLNMTIKFPEDFNKSTDCIFGLDLPRSALRGPIRHNPNFSTAKKDNNKTMAIDLGKPCAKGLEKGFEKDPENGFANGFAKPTSTTFSWKESL